MTSNFSDKLYFYLERTEKYQSELNVLQSQGGYEYILLVQHRYSCMIPRRASLLPISRAQVESNSLTVLGSSMSHWHLAFDTTNV